MAEVLITLGIIGVVAAMTVPTLVAKYQEKQIVSQLMKTYSTLSQAIQRVETEYGPINTWDLSDTDTKETDENDNKIYDHSAQSLFAQRLKQYLKVTKTCELNVICDTRPSFSINGEKTANSSTVRESSDSPPEANFFLNDGTFIGIGYYNKRDRTLDIGVTLPQKRRVLGQTRYFFKLTSKRLLPEGAPLLNKTSFKQHCASAGRSCAAWVIYNKNLDYLHCPDKLDWDKAHSCK